MTTLSEICIHLERADGAALLYDWLRSWDAQVSNSGVTLQGPIAFHAGCLVTLLGRFDQADGHFTQALKVGQKLDAPYWIATRIAWAQLDRKARSPNAGRAETMLADALRSAKHHGFGALVDEIDRVQGKEHPRSP